MITNIRSAFIANVHTLSWMDKKTQNRVEDKVTFFLIHDYFKRWFCLSFSIKSFAMLKKKLFRFRILDFFFAFKRIQGYQMPELVITLKIKIGMKKS